MGRLSSEEVGDNRVDCGRASVVKAVLLDVEGIAPSDDGGVGVRR